MCARGRVFARGRQSVRCTYPHRCVNRKFRLFIYRSAFFNRFPQSPSSRPFHSLSLFYFFSVFLDVPCAGVRVNVSVTFVKSLDWVFLANNTNQSVHTRTACLRLRYCIALNANLNRFEPENISKQCVGKRKQTMNDPIA